MTPFFQRGNISTGFSTQRKRVLNEVKMEDLSERQKIILSLVIHEYTRTVAPVGSKSLVDQYQLDFSPATVRNELAALTELNFLRQPHTSAGRVPTESGYRYFVGFLMRTQELSDATRRMIEHQFYQTQQEQGIDASGNLLS